MMIDNSGLKPKTAALFKLLNTDGFSLVYYVVTRTFLRQNRKKKLILPESLLNVAIDRPMLVMKGRS